MGICTTVIFVFRSMEMQSLDPEREEREFEDSLKKREKSFKRLYKKMCLSKRLEFDHFLVYDMKGHIHTLMEELRSDGVIPLETYFYTDATDYEVLKIYKRELEFDQDDTSL